MIGILCGLQAEAALLTGLDWAKVYCGAPGARQLATDLATSGLSGLVSFGTAGALWPQLAVGDVVLGTLLVTDQGVRRPDADWLAHLPGGPHVKRVAVLSLGAVSADTPAQRAALFAKYRTVAIDEESATVAQLAETHNLPFLVVRCISDTATQTLPPAALIAQRPDGSADIWKVLRSILAAPSQDGDLAKLAAQLVASLNSLRSYLVTASSAIAAA